jgi:phage-related protein
MKKIVRFHIKALEEYHDLPPKVQKALEAIIKVLQRSGELREPLGKKINGYKNLYEIRIKKYGQWRSFYGYLSNNIILVTHIFNKKTQKTPQRSIKLAIKRLSDNEK